LRLAGCEIDFIMPLDLRREQALAASAKESKMKPEARKNESWDVIDLNAAKSCG